MKHTPTSRTILLLETAAFAAHFVSGSAHAAVGYLDWTFGGGGEVETKVGDFAGGEVLIVQLDSKPVPAGTGFTYNRVSGGNYTFAMARYLP